MAKLGAFCDAATGHINPMTALLRRMQQRGHQVVFFGVADTEKRVRDRGINFHLIGQQDFPLGTIRSLDRRLGELQGRAAMNFAFDRAVKLARMTLRDSPQAIRDENIDALLVDEIDMAGNVAEYLGMPFVSVAIIPPLLRVSTMPPFCFGWKAGLDPISRLRNRIGHSFVNRIAQPIYAAINEQRRAWGLKPIDGIFDILSPLARVSQLPAALEFHQVDAPLLHYAGPFVDHEQRPHVDFPWERLDGRRPLIYASLGTMQNGVEGVYRTIAEACAGVDAQLILSLGGGLDPEHLGPLPGDPIVVRFAPQLDLVKRAALVITHAGINTTLESLSEGVPLVALPIANDQPGVAARVAARGAGIVIPIRKLDVEKLRRAVRAVIEDGRYRAAAENLAHAINRVDGLDFAADVIELALRIGPVPVSQTQASWALGG